MSKADALMALWRPVPAWWDAARRHALARPALAVYALALLVRLLFNLTAAAPYHPTFDAALYEIIARNLINRHCYCIFSTHVTVARAPLWPWIMAGIYLIFGQNNFYARLFYCLLGSGTCVFVYYFARDLFGRRTGLLAGVLASVYVGLFLYDGWLYTESLYTFCVTGATYALYRAQTAGRHEAAHNTSAALWQRLGDALRLWRWELLCGLLIGAASLTRPNGLALLGVSAVCAAIIVVARRRSLRGAVSSVVLITLLTVALVAPWTARNYAVSRAFVPVETGMGEVLLGSYNDTVAFGPTSSRGLWRPPPGALNHDNVAYTPATDHRDTSRALRWMSDHPLAVVYLWGLHLIHLWSPYTYTVGMAIQQSPHRLVSYVVWGLIFGESIPIFLLAALGLIATWRRSKLALVPIYLVLGVTVLESTLILAIMRFRAPIEPLLVVLAAAGIAALLRRAESAGRLPHWLARASAGM